MAENEYHHQCGTQPDSGNAVATEDHTARGMATPLVCDTCGHAHELGVRCDICGHVGSAALVGMGWVRPSSCAPGCTWAEHVLPCLEVVRVQQRKRQREEEEAQAQKRHEEEKRRHEAAQHEQYQQQRRDERERLAERSLKVRRTVADEVAALSASSSHMDDALTQFALTELPREMLTVVMSHLEWRPEYMMKELMQQFKMLTFLTSSCGTTVRQCALQLLDEVQESWICRLATLSTMFSGRPGVLACVDVEGLRAKWFVEQRPEAAPWLDPRLLDTWASLPAHCRVGALAAHMTRVGDRIEVLLNGNECSPIVRRVCKQLRAKGLSAKPKSCKREVIDGISRFTTALVAGGWYDDHGDSGDGAPTDSGDEDYADDYLSYMKPDRDFSYDFAGYPAGVFALSTPPVAALLMDGWAAFIEQVEVMHADETPEGAVSRMVQYVSQEVYLAMFEW